jgi:hypothetical protein
MSDQVKQIIRRTVSEMPADSVLEQNIRRIAEKICRESSFCVDSYRIIGGILQGLNIKLGNFIG